MVLKKEDFLEKFWAKLRKILNFIDFSLIIKVVHVKA